MAAAHQRRLISWERHSDWGRAGRAASRLAYHPEDSPAGAPPDVVLIGPGDLVARCDVFMTIVEISL